MVKMSKSDQKELHANWDKLSKTPERIKWMKMQYPNKKKCTSVLWTSEKPSRRVIVKGRSAIEPNCMVVEVEGAQKLVTGVWMYSTGYLHPLGSNVFAADTPETARRVRDSFQ